ncbi:hypothetical protein [Pseudolactococcus piscium]|uniref:Uncharacterized protein n=1 Tax=Pseudolactococcus piscium MKFS47 TaxID=297352 RepID=A0A0D6DWQ4_9LACT|nr:hypothetical protein [Lactococcus piscium]CEN27936.1 Uncharacterized protein LACPI_0736 [Lactococcus piscium MKFS47]
MKKMDSILKKIKATPLNQRIAISRGGIGLEKGSILLNYVLNFDSTGNYVSGSVTSSGYVSTSLNLVAGQNYIGQTVNFITTTGGYAGSGSYIYPIIANITLT